MFEKSRTWAEVDLDAIRQNLKTAKGLLRPETKIAAVVKADAYGLGARRVAETLCREGVDMLAVACLSEAAELRGRFPDIPILVMGYTPDECFDEVVRLGITQTIYSAGQARALSNAAVQTGRKIKIHIKIDTGFNRLGIKPGKNCIEEIENICANKNLFVEGIFSHLALNSEQDDKKQFQLFGSVIRQAEEKGLKFPIKHICDSIGMIRYPQYHLDMVRPGAFLYGAGPSHGPRPDLKICAALKTRVSRVAVLEDGEGVSYDYIYRAKGRRVIATLCAGYSDGYPRSLSGKGDVIIRGKRAPIVGLACMDQCIADVTDIPETAVGDEVLLYGRDKNYEIPLQEAADRAGTNKNELLSRIGRRVPRVYSEFGKECGVLDYTKTR